MEHGPGDRKLTRRAFLKGAAAGVLVAAAAPSYGSEVPGAEPSTGERKEARGSNRLPRWRGFNLQEMFTVASEGDWKDDDFRWMSDWGFDFVRLPMCYTLWIEGDDIHKIKEAGLAKVDRAVELGRKHKIHVNLNFHRGPGYSVNPERQEPFNLWKDRDALDAFCLHWQTFAERYKGIPSSQLSFNLINEPPAVGAEMSREDHERVVRTTTQTIRKADPDRLVIADGVGWANVPCPELVDLGIGQSCRAYTPFELTHYNASWVGGSDTWAEPVWPDLKSWGTTWNRERLEEHYRPWIELVKQGVGVHCGEGGAWNRTRHSVMLAWLRDVLEILRPHGIGYALWTFRGGFGVLDSDRPDVEYEEFHGHKLDRKLLSLLQEF